MLVKAISRVISSNHLGTTKQNVLLGKYKGTDIQITSIEQDGVVKYKSYSLMRDAWQRLFYKYRANKDSRFSTVG